MGWGNEQAAQGRKLSPLLVDICNVEPVGIFGMGRKGKGMGRQDKEGLPVLSQEAQKRKEDGRGWATGHQILFENNVFTSQLRPCLPASISYECELDPYLLINTIRYTCK